jgi:uncharacterized DUF497 family protein
MKYIKFIWDEKKAKSNVNKHGIAFDEAATVFDDDNARVIYDPDHSKEEDRFIILGLSCSMKVLVVCHCYRENDKQIRIISARKGDKKEQKQYWGFIK